MVDPRVPPPVQSPSPLDVTLDHFTDPELLGHGGYADVYRATLRDDPDVVVALKQPRFHGTLTEDVVRRFEREAETWARLDDHDHVVGVLDWGTKPYPWIALEFMDGGSVADALERGGGKMDVSEALYVGISVADAIRHAHRHGVVHLDLKPENVLFRMSEDGYWNVPKVSDWGLARLMLGQSQSMVGLSPQYAAPEQFDPDTYGTPDDFTDIYQLGALVYELVTGQAPFGNDAMQAMNGVLHGELRPPTDLNPDLPASLDEALLTAMAREKADRYEAEIDFRRALEAVFETVTGGESPGSDDADHRRGTDADGPTTRTSNPPGVDEGSTGKSSTVPLPEAGGLSRRGILRAGAGGVALLGAGYIANDLLGGSAGAPVADVAVTTPSSASETAQPGIAEQPGTERPTEPSDSTASAGGDSATTPDRAGLVVIGYPESGAQLFRDYYDQTDGDHSILVPDGLRDGSLPGRVGNEMHNVTGTAPATAGPNHAAFEELFENAYGTSPGVFAAQSFDSVALGILANAAAGENSGPAIRDQMRRIANPGGMTVGPQNLVEGVEAAANGEEVNYQGASSTTNFDRNGDLASAAYAIWEFEGQDASRTNTVAVETFDGGTPNGAGPAASDGPGGFNGEITVGILLPASGDLASVGRAMIRAAELPAQLVNDASPQGLSVDVRMGDTQTSPDAGVAAAESLVNAGVPFVCGPASSGVNVPVATQVLVPNEVVGCSPSSTALSLSTLNDDDFIFRTAPSDMLQGRAMAQVMAERLGVSRASTLYVNNDYGRQLSERFASEFESSFGGDVISQVPFDIGRSSYGSVLTRALSGLDG